MNSLIINEEDQLGRTPLSNATNFDEAFHLIKSGHNPRHINRYGVSVVHLIRNTFVLRLVLSHSCVFKHLSFEEFLRVNESLPEKATLLYNILMNEETYPGLYKTLHELEVMYLNKHNPDIKWLDDCEDMIAYLYSHDTSCVLSPSFYQTIQRLVNDNN